MGLGKLLTGAYYGRYDKTVHFFASAAVTAVLAVVLPLWIAAAAAFAVGIGKELSDWFWRKGRVGWDDLAVDALAIAVVTAAFTWLPQVFTQ